MIGDDYLLPVMLGECVTEFISLQRLFETRHSGNTNLLFLDMHIENMNRLSITDDMVIP